jgi:hypothetical protein
MGRDIAVAARLDASAIGAGEREPIRGIAAVDLR